MSVRRLWLIPVLVCVFSVALIVPTTAHAQVHTQHTSQQQTIANDQPEYFFYAGAWGWGYCFSHSTIQSLGNGAGHGLNVLTAVVAAIFSKNPWASPIALGAVEGMRWYMEAIDRGNGDCLAFAFGSPAFPLMWGR